MQRLPLALLTNRVFPVVWKTYVQIINKNSILWYISKFSSEQSWENCFDVVITNAKLTKMYNSRYTTFLKNEKFQPNNNIKVFH